MPRDGSLRSLAPTAIFLAWSAVPLVVIPAAGQAAQGRGAPAALMVQVRDVAGSPVAGAEVLLLTADRALLAAARADTEGLVEVPLAATGRFLLVVRADGFAEHRRPLDLDARGDGPVEITLDVAGIQEEVTVTAAADTVQDAARSAQPVAIISEDDIALRAKTVVAQVASEEAGVHLQRTSPTMAGIYVRGFTGNKVNVFVDGARFTTGAQRGGVNTFLDLIEPATLEVVEVLRGPNSAQYGSDAIGGSVQFLSRVPSISPDGRSRFGGEVVLQGGTAEMGIGGSAIGSFSTRSLGLLGTLAARNVDGLRPGRGVDSHAAVTRFFGLSSDRLMPSRLPDTGFRQVGGSVKANWIATPRTQVVAQYRRTAQDGGKRYDQLLGGDGNLLADLRDLSLDLVTARLERLEAGWFDDASVTYSLNSQREERVNQGGNGNPRATITFEPERTTAHGIQASASSRLNPRVTLGLGGDVYFESVSATSTGLDPVSEVATVRRGRVPDGATYRNGGLWLQGLVDAVPDRLRLVGNLRWSGASYRARAADSPTASGEPLWPDDSLSLSSVTFRLGAVMSPSDTWTFAATAGRGFRAPHITDLGTLGLTGSGFEVAAPDVAGLGATVGTSADAQAVSTGNPVEQVEPESSFSFEGSVRFRTRRLRAEVTVFRSTLYDSLEKQALILPPGAVGTEIGGEPIVAQAPGGAVFVPVATSPVLVRTNLFDAVNWGVEHSGEVQLSGRVALSTVFTYVHSAEKGTGLPPNIEGGTPPPNGYLMLRFTSGDGRWWAQPYVHAAARQERLSSLDISDRRTGATRSRTNIRNFFFNGATVRGWVGPGLDGTAGTADDVLLSTGETLAEVQDRVLGAGVVSAPLFRSVAGYVVFGVRGGWRVGRHALLVEAENLTDRSYRGVSWGVDAPGRGVSLRYQVRF